MPSNLPKARSARLSRSRRASTSITGSGGSAGGTKARTVSPATGVSTKRPSRRLDDDVDMPHYADTALFNQLELNLNSD